MCTGHKGIHNTQSNIMNIFVQYSPLSLTPSPERERTLANIRTHTHTQIHTYTHVHTSNIHIHIRPHPKKQPFLCWFFLQHIHIYIHFTVTSLFTSLYLLAIQLASTQKIDYAIDTYDTPLEQKHTLLIHDTTQHTYVHMHSHILSHSINSHTHKDMMCILLFSFHFPSLPLALTQQQQQQQTTWWENDRKSVLWNYGMLRECHIHLINVCYVALLLPLLLHALCATTQRLYFVSCVSFRPIIVLTTITICCCVL
jgi:hypothetical protein